MSIQSDYALLAAGSYWDIRKFDSTFDNRAPLPAGWTVLTTYDVSGSGANSSLLGSGFSARVYKGPGGEIVIGYAGTEAGNTVTGLVDDFVKANVPMAAGAANTQALAAAQLYERVRADIAAGKVVGANGNISFTGHSLGGRFSIRHGRVV